MNKAMRAALAPVADKVAFADAVLKAAGKYGLVPSATRAVRKPRKAKAAGAPKRGRKPKATPPAPAVPRADAVVDGLP